MLHYDPRQYIITTTDELSARMVGLDDERHQAVYSGQAEVVHRLRCLNEQHGNKNKAVLKKGSKWRKFEPGEDEEQFNDELQGFR